MRSDPDSASKTLGDASIADWLQLLARHGLAPARARRLLAETGHPAAAWRAGGGGAALDAAALGVARRRLRASGAVLLPCDDPGYPRALAALPDAPCALFVRGRLESLSRPAVALVGPRAPSAYGLGVARRLAGDLARHGVVVVSGLARGVDAAAHEACLDAGGETIAVLACGPDAVYPRNHAALADRVVRSGAVVTELLPGTEPRPFLFPLRNRLISGLSAVVVIVEARERSGSLVTARHALDQGVEVLAVPGPIDRATSRGTNRLLRDGAAPLLETGDVLDRLGRPREEGRDAPARPLAPLQDAVHRRLAREPATRDELVARGGWPSAELALALLELELLGRIERDRDGRWRVVGEA